MASQEGVKQVAQWLALLALVFSMGVGFNKLDARIEKNHDDIARKADKSAIAEIRSASSRMERVMERLEQVTRRLEIEVATVRAERKS